MDKDLVQVILNNVSDASLQAKVQEEVERRYSLGVAIRRIRALARVRPEILQGRLPSNEVTRNDRMIKYITEFLLKEEAGQSSIIKEQK